MKKTTKAEQRRIDQRIDEYLATRKPRVLAELLVQLEDKLRGAFMRGVEAAAGIAAEYDSHSTLPSLPSDCILVKLNAPGARPPRKNPHAGKAFVRGFALALSEVQRRHSQESTVAEVMRDAGVSLEEMIEAGVEEYDTDVIKKCLPLPRRSRSYKAKNARSRA